MKLDFAIIIPMANEQEDFGLLLGYRLYGITSGYQEFYTKNILKRVV